MAYYEDLTRGLNPEKALATLILIHISEFDARIFTDDLAETTIDPPPKMIAASPIGFGRLAFRKKGTDVIETVDAYWVDVGGISGTLINMRASFFQGIYTDEDHKFALAAHEVRHRCQHRIAGISLVGRENIVLFPELWNWMRFCQSRCSSEMITSNEFDALMIEELVRQAACVVCDLTDEFLDHMASVISARNPLELRKILNSFNP